MAAAIVAAWFAFIFCGGLTVEHKMVWGCKKGFIVVGCIQPENPTNEVRKN